MFEQFLPRRMAFVYEFEVDEFGVVPDIPTTVRRSKADCPQVGWAGQGETLPEMLPQIQLLGQLQRCGAMRPSPAALPPPTSALWLRCPPQVAEAVFARVDHHVRALGSVPVPACFFQQLRLLSRGAR